MGRPPRWYDYLEPVTATVPCNGAHHRVTWRRGRLVLEDHDLGAERAMLALGGQPCVCMQVLRMWRDQWGLNPEMLRTNAWLRDRSYLLPGEFAQPRRVAGFRNWDRVWRRSSYITKHGALLEADLRDLATGPLHRLCLAAAPSGQRPGPPSISITLARHGNPPAITGLFDNGRAKVTACLGVPWLVRVWGRGAPLVDRAFVLDVVDDHWSGTIVRAARWVDRPNEGRHLVVGRAQLRTPDSGDQADQADQVDRLPSGGPPTLIFTGEDETESNAHAGPPAPRSIFDMDPSELFKTTR